MAQSTAESGLRTKSMERESMNGLMAENTMGNGKTTTCMEEESTHGKMEGNMKEIT